MKAGLGGADRLTGNARSRYRYGAFILLFIILISIFFFKVYSSRFSFLSAAQLPQNIENVQASLSSAERFVMTGRIDINIADIDGLVILPGVGRRIAKRIIRRRAELGGFTRVDDLLSVEGIGSGKLAAIKAFLDRQQVL
jgi:competence protein ComEA